MPGVARLGDNISHIGTITSASTVEFVDSIGVARVGDSVNCSKHGPQTIVSGSNTVQADGKKVARIGDSISCGATITTGSSTVIAG